MESKRKEKLDKIIADIRLAVDAKTAARLELDKSARLVKRLSSLSIECEDCEQYLAMLEIQLSEINDRKESLTKEDIKEHYKKTEEVSSHLMKQHKLVPTGYYMGVYMSIGIGIGFLFGLSPIDNIVTGLLIGMVLGMAVGMWRDNEAKKKGTVI